MGEGNGNSCFVFKLHRLGYKSLPLEKAFAHLHNHVYILKTMYAIVSLQVVVLLLLQLNFLAVYDFMKKKSNGLHAN